MRRWDRSVLYFAPKDVVLRDGLVVDLILHCSSFLSLAGAAVSIVFRTSVA